MREVVTNETGIVVELNGDMAKVCVDRVINLGRCCAKLDVSEKTMVEVKNICNAKLNDEVAINSTHDIARNRNAVTFSGTFLAFAVGTAFGNALLPRLGIFLGTPVSAGIGLVLGCIALFLIRNAFRKDRLPALAAYEIVKSSDKLPVI
jgi:multisubunit Na+/H+ antiporter MnhE subunit